MTTQKLFSTYSAHFDGATSYIEATSEYFGSMGNAFTLAAWVRPAVGADGGIHAIVGATSEPLLFLDGGGKLGCGGPGLGYAYQTAALPVGQWTHVLCAGSSGGGFSLYQNGTNPASVTYNSGVTVGGLWAVGAQVLPNGPRYLFNGDIDEVRIYSRHVSGYSDSDVRNLYTCNMTTVCPTIGTATATATSSSSFTFSVAQTATATGIVTVATSDTSTATITRTVAATSTATETYSFTQTATGSASTTGTVSTTATASASTTMTAYATTTVTATHTITVSKSATATISTSSTASHTAIGTITVTASGR